MFALGWKNGLVGIVSLAFVVGCGADASREDAQDTKNVDKTPPHVIAFNNRYPNVSTKCDGYGHRIYVTTGTGRITVIADPSCPGYNVVEGER